MILTHGANSLPRGGEGMTVTIGGRKYPVVQIGNQLWMADNLDYAWSGLVVGSTYSQSEPRANYYNNDEEAYGANGNKFGLLYNWYAVTYLDDNKLSLLPDGWHVPSNDEFNALIHYINPNAGKKLKSSTVWNGTDEYGFNAVPSGQNINDVYTLINEQSNYWTITVYDRSNARKKYLNTSSDLMPQNYNSKSYGYSIRLVKDA